MAGIQIDGVNNKIDFDDDAYTSISSATDDTLVVEVGGNTLATVTATSVTINDGVVITTADNTDTLTECSCGNCDDPENCDCDPYTCDCKEVITVQDPFNKSHIFKDKG